VYNSILVPLDGSKRAEAILPHVENLAQRYNAKVTFLQVVEPAPVVVGPEAAYTVLHQHELAERTSQAESYLAARQGEFREKGIEAWTRVVYGPVVEAIIDAAEAEDADLIAIASHGRSGLSRVFYGSVAAGVLHRVDRPLLLIRS
jgi:nucleotide-binding universal stress UspA family protein